MLRWSAGVGVVLCVFAAGMAGTAAAAVTPKFASAQASFQNPNITVSFTERGLGRRQQVRYELHGMRHTVYECADGSNSVEFNGPILNNASGGPYGSTPVTITLTSTKSGVAKGSLIGQPEPAVQFTGTWGPLTCADGSPPVMTADQFYGETDEPLSVLDTTHGIRRTLQGVYGFCSTIAYHCVS